MDIWAADTRQNQSPDPAFLTALDRSRFANVLDAGQRLFELEPSQIRAELGLPDNTVVTIHHDGALSKQNTEKAERPIKSSAPCAIDWIFRADSAYGPPPVKTAFFTENHAQMSYYSYFRAYRDGRLVMSVKGVHRGHLPVLSGSEKDKAWVYDTREGTRHMVANAAEKIRDKLGAVNLADILKPSARGN